jgi:hypothetical protein
MPSFSLSSFISLPSSVGSYSSAYVFLYDALNRRHILNLTISTGGSVDVRGNKLVFTFIPPATRAFAGRLARKSRVDRAAAMKGLNLVFTSVINLVIMVGGSA